MYKLILALLVVSSYAIGFDWIECEKQPYPQKERIIFYETITKIVYLDCPEIFSMGFFYTYQDYPCIKHWAKVPDSPAKNALEWIDCDKTKMPMYDPCLFYDKTTDAVYIDIPYEYCVYLSHYLELMPNITHFKKIPEKPLAVSKR